MKRKLITRNKIRMSDRFKLQDLALNTSYLKSTCNSFEYIAKIKLRGQMCYQRRIYKQMKLNPRQLKKLRRKQLLNGLIGSKFEGACKVPLKQASAVFRKRN
jgi:signal-transduction protein with cAMP-binding, CBS, and nucleotidyltransferase domain